MISLCYYYTNTGYPTFRPKCRYSVDKRAGLHCHHPSTAHCPGYINEDQIKLLNDSLTPCPNCKGGSND